MLRKSPYPASYPEKATESGGWRIVYFWFIEKQTNKQTETLGIGKEGAEVLACSFHPIVESVTFSSSKHTLTLTTERTTLFARILSYSLTLLMVAINI